MSSALDLCQGVFILQISSGNARVFQRMSILSMKNIVHRVYQCLFLSMSIKMNENALIVAAPDLVKDTLFIWSELRGISMMNVKVDLLQALN